MYIYTYWETLKIFLLKVRVLDYEVEAQELDQRVDLFLTGILINGFKKNVIAGEITDKEAVLKATRNIDTVFHVVSPTLANQPGCVYDDV